MNKLQISQWELILVLRPPYELGNENENDLACVEDFLMSQGADVT